MTTSKTVQAKISELYAMLATATAQKALDSVVVEGDCDLAEYWVKDTLTFLNKAGADATKWTYEKPRK